MNINIQNDCAHYAVSDSSDVLSFKPTFSMNLNGWEADVDATIATAMDDENLLRELLKQATQPNLSDRNRRLALNRLLYHVMQLPGLIQSTHPDYTFAFNRTLEWFCQHLHEFEPRFPSWEKSLVAWLNGYLRWRIGDLYRRDWRQLKKQVSLDAPTCFDINPTTYLEQLSETKPSLSVLEHYIEAGQIRERYERVHSFRKYLEADPDKIFRQCHPRKAPHCNCQVLAKRLLLKEPSARLSTLARVYNVNYQTLNSHWKKKCLPLLQEAAQRQGLHPPNDEVGL